AEAGLRVIATETFAPDGGDFTPLLLKLRLRSPDVIYIASSDAGSLRLIEQMRRLRIRAQDVHHAMLPGAISLAASAAAGNAIEGVTATIPWYPGVAGPYADLAARVVAEAGIDMFDSPGTMSRLSAYLVVVQALERAGAADREKLRAALHKGVFELPTGRISFDEKGLAGDAGTLALQIQEGRPVVVWPPEISAGRYLYPSPAWN
ncbi:MAG: ABC transporter substrate-binding protein, partial [Rhodospirillaceae bacterium]